MRASNCSGTAPGQRPCSTLLIWNNLTVAKANTFIMGQGMAFMYIHCLRLMGMVIGSLHLENRHSLQETERLFLRDKILRGRKPVWPKMSQGRSSLLIIGGVICTP